MGLEMAFWMRYLNCFTNGISAAAKDIRGFVYWILKPGEWVGVGVIWWLADDMKQVTRGIYRGGEEESGMKPHSGHWWGVARRS
jgi:hypothetical protein